MKKTIAVLLFLVATAAVAQEQGSKVLLHGFGEWAYTRTDGNEYLNGGEEGDYDTVGLGLNATAPIHDKLTIVGQFAVRSRHGDSPGAELDYAFAQWKFSDALALRFGRSKHPFGLYTEIFDIGTLRPFFHLPLSIYGPTEIAAQSYDGVGLTGTRKSFDYDLYVGEISFAQDQRLHDDEDAELEESEQVRDVIGGRLRYHTPVEGLSFGASAYTGVLEEEGGAEEEGEDESRHVGAGLHAEYALHPLTLRAEVGRHKETAEGSTKALYLEAAYRVGTKWELAGRYDHFDQELEDDDEESVEHRDLSFGVNYWFNPNFVLKLSLHRVKGLGAVHVEDDDADDRTSAIVFGSQFTF